MSDEPTSYRREFFASPHHAWLGLATLGAGFVAGASAPVFLLAGVTAYALGWVYLPDLRFFRHWVDQRRNAGEQQVAQAELDAFARKRDEMLNALSPSRRERYQQLGRVCREIETATGESPLAPADPAFDPRLRRLDELMWAYLRMLSIEQSLAVFQEKEQRDDIPRLVEETERKTMALTAEIEALKTQARPELLETKQKLFQSLVDRLDVLRKRLHRLEHAEANLALVLSEEERLEEQLKLLRADAVASKNTGALTARIDATVEQLGHTNKWIAELDEFKDLVGDLPRGDARVGYGVPAAPTPTRLSPPPLFRPNPPNR